MSLHLIALKILLRKSNESETLQQVNLYHHAVSVTGTTDLFANQFETSLSVPFPFTFRRMLEVRRQRQSHPSKAPKRIRYL